MKAQITFKQERLARFTVDNLPEDLAAIAFSADPSPEDEFRLLAYCNSNCSDYDEVEPDEEEDTWNLADAIDL